MDTKMKTMNESYFCTWNVQGEVAQKNTKAKEAGEIKFEGDQGALCSRDAICELQITCFIKWQTPKRQKNWPFN